MNNIIKKAINIALETTVALLSIYFVFGVNLLTALLDEGIGSVFQAIGSNIYLLLYILLLILISARAEAFVVTFKNSLRNWKLLLRFIIVVIAAVLVYKFLLPSLTIGSLVPAYGLIAQFVVALIFG